MSYAGGRFPACRSYAVVFNHLSAGSGRKVVGKANDEAHFLIWKVNRLPGRESDKRTWHKAAQTPEWVEKG